MGLPEIASTEVRDKLTQYERQLQQFVSNVNYFLGTLGAEETARKNRITEEARNLMSVLKDLILGATKYQGNEFEGLLGIIIKRTTTAELLDEIHAGIRFVPVKTPAAVEGIRRNIIDRVQN